MNTLLIAAGVAAAIAAAGAGAPQEAAPRNVGTDIVCSVGFENAYPVDLQSPNCTGPSTPFLDVQP